MFFLKKKILQNLVPSYFIMGIMNAKDGDWGEKNEGGEKWSGGEGQIERGHRTGKDDGPVESGFLLLLFSSGCNFGME